MSVAALTVVVAVALLGIAIALNQVMARLALVEVTLTEGLPPGHQRPAVGAATAATTTDPSTVLAEGVHLFLSRSCHACQRLADELQHRSLDLSAPVTLRYVDRPRPLARELATQLGAELTEHDHELAQSVGADPLPYTVAIGLHGLSAGSVSPTVHDVVATARNAGHGPRVTA